MASQSDKEMKAKLNEALVLNRKMQFQLLSVREKLEKLLRDVKCTYKANDVVLKEGIVKQRKKGIGIKGAYLKGGTFYLKGNMFFKDIKCRNCPNNPDYEKRKLENEIFPMDFDLQARHIWSTKDKQGIILGIKEQIIDYLTQSSKRLCVTKNEIDSEKLAKLLNMVPKDFHIDWDHISSFNVQHRHSAKTCEAIWNVFLHPSLKRTSWSEEENLRLLESAKKYNFQNWQAIANEVGQRSDFQCFVQFQNHVCYMLPEGSSKWTKEDDMRLMNVISKNTVHGVINWSNVMAYFPHKAKTTLHSRYFYTLNPEINRAPFTPEEDLLLIAAVKEYGAKFNCLPRNLFPNRTVVQLRSRYKNTLSKRHNHQPWTLEDDIKLMDFVTQNGSKSWLECEKALHGKHSRISCRTRFLVIKKYLEKNPDGSIESIPRKRGRPYGAINTENWKEMLEELATNPKANLRKKIRFKKVKPTKLTKENTQLIKKKYKTMKRKPNNTNTNESKKIYISRLKSNGIKNYNFFKYAYNFNINKHPSDSIQLSYKNLKFIMSALNPQIPSSFQNYKFDTSLPDHVKSNIKVIPSQFANIQKSLLVPSWSTALGFRALCIHTACNDSEDIPLTILNNENNHIKIFRERLRTIFYSTALLSRLDPGTVGITIPEIQNDKNKFGFERTENQITVEKPNGVKRKRSPSKNNNKNLNEAKNKNKYVNDLANIEIKFET